MTTIEVSVYTPISPTERVEKVVSAVEKIFPGLIMDIRNDRIEAYSSLDSLRTLHKLLREQEILDSARSVMLKGQTGNTICSKLNKQAAYMGRVNLLAEEEPLGSINVQIIGEGLIDWLAPKTENGIPIKEIDSGCIEDAKISSPKTESVEEDV
jgi:uncharacterized protein